jgi:hypothetical protein
MKKSSLICMLLISSLTFSQTDESNSVDDNIKSLRIGLKLGVPNGIGGNLEYVTPLFGQRLALYGDYSGLSADIDDVDTSLNYFEIGTNIYFTADKGSGFYASLSYGSLSIDGSYSEAETIDGQPFTGEAEGDFDVSSFNAKLGFKVGRGFYFRTELGYGFGEVPQEINITGNVNGIPETGVEEIPDIPGVGESGYLMFNLQCHRTRIVLIRVFLCPGS